MDVASTFIDKLMGFPCPDLPPNRSNSQQYSLPSPHWIFVFLSMHPEMTTIIPYWSKLGKTKRFRIHGAISWGHDIYTSYLNADNEILPLRRGWVQLSKLRRFLFSVFLPDWLCNRKKENCQPASQTLSLLLKSFWVGHKVTSPSIDIPCFILWSHLNLQA